MFQFAASAYFVYEGEESALITVRRTGDISSSIAVDYVVSDGIAQRGVDYQAVAGTLHFAPGETNQTLTVKIIDDGLVEGDETIHLALMKPQGNASLADPAKATITIIDNEIPTTLDPTFSIGTGFTLADGSPSGVNSLAVQADGEILVSGRFVKVNGVARNGFARLNQDGVLDASFEIVPPLWGSGDSPATAMMPLPVRKILVWGSFANAIARLQNDGSVDTAFSVRVTGPAFTQVEAVAFQPDGRLIIAGHFATVNGVKRKNIARLNVDGSLDASFDPGPGPSYIAEPLSGSVSTVALQSDGRILISGGFDSVSGVRRSNFARLLPDGSLDASFSYGFDAAGLVGVQPDGRILVSDLTLKRLTFDGNVDTSFNPPFRTALVGRTAFGYFAPVTFRANGKILFVGSAETPFGARNGLVQLNEDGSLDVSVPTPLFLDAYGNTVSPSSFALLPDGRILAGGAFVSVNGVPSTGLVRLFGDNTGPTNFEFTAPESGVSENRGSLSISVERSGDTTKPGAVEYFTGDGSAFAGVDYVPQIGTLHFAPLEVHKSVIIPIVGHPGTNLDKTFQLTLTKPADGAIIGAGPASITLTIADDERPGSVVPDFDLALGPDIYGSVFVGGFLSSGIEQQPDGKLIFSGGFSSVHGLTPDPSDFGFVRLNPDGSLDSNFRLPPVQGPEECPDCGGVWSVLPQSDGKLLLSGNFIAVAGISRTNFARLNVDGSVDETFTAELPPVWPLVPLFVATDRRIVVGGGDVFVLNANGSLAYDAQVPALGTWDSSWWLRSAFMQSDGKLLIQGHFNSVGGISATNVARLNRDGTLDKSFKWLTSMRFVGLQPDDAILASGYDLETGEDILLARFNPDGSFDKTFKVDAPSPGYTHSVAFQADGKILVAGANNATAGGFLFRLNPDGSLDRNFSATVVGGDLNQAALTLNGQILIAGSFRAVNGLPRRGLALLNSGFNPPRFIRSSGDGASWRLTVANLPNRSCVLEASTDWKLWLPVLTNSASGPSLEFEDNTVSELARRFYRARAVER